MNYTADDLRKVLCDNLSALQKNEMSPIEANARASQIREITRIVGTQLRGFAQFGIPHTEEVAEFLRGRQQVKTAKKVVAVR